MIGCIVPDDAVEAIRASTRLSNQLRAHARRGECANPQDTYRDPESYGGGHRDWFAGNHNLA